MNDHAYDISHLLDIESAVPAAPAAPPRKLTIARAVLPLASALAMQAALAQELLQSAAAHEDMIQEYLRTRSESASQSPH